jgi:prepilin-type N-terminal cleavage/methylation domain-containing protein
MKHTQNGYSLIETLVAITLLLIISAPLLSGIFGNNQAIRSENLITGIGILEQEARLISANPQNAVPEKIRVINGQTWKIITHKSGTPVTTYHLQAIKGSKRVGEIYFLQNELNK